MQEDCKIINNKFEIMTEFPRHSGLFGVYGGRHVPEPLVPCLEELENAFYDAMNDPTFHEEYRSYYPYMGRPSSLHVADRLTEKMGGARIWLKREDLNHMGSHKINNALAQALLAKRMGKKRVIAETGAGQHGVATATACAKFGLSCVVYMGADDCRKQALNVFRMRFWALRSYRWRGAINRYQMRSTSLLKTGW